MANTFKTDQKDSRGRPIYKDRDTGTYFTIDPKTGAKVAGQLGANDPKNKEKASQPVSQAPTVKTESPSGDISGDTNAGNRFGNFSLALKNAINEGSADRKAMQMGAVMPFVTGNVGGMSSVVDFITQNAQTSATSVLSSVMGGFEAEIEDQRKKQEFAYNVIKDMANDGSLGQIPDSALLSMGAQAGLPQGTLLAWRSRISSAAKISDEKAQLEIQKIESEIEENLASAAASGRSNRGGDGSGDGLGEMTNDEASLIDSALANLSEEDASILNSLGTKELKKKWLISRGRSQQVEESPSGAADMLVSQGLKFLFGTPTKAAAPKSKGSSLMKQLGFE